VSFRTWRLDLPNPNMMLSPLWCTAGSRISQKFTSGSSSSSDTAHSLLAGANP
jgi:hypothetical protein